MLSQTLKASGRRHHVRSRLADCGGSPHAIPGLQPHHVPLPQAPWRRRAAAAAIHDDVQPAGSDGVHIKATAAVPSTPAQTAAAAAGVPASTAASPMPPCTAMCMGDGHMPEDESTYGRGAVKVGAHSPVRKTAGLIAHLLRAGISAAVLAGGNRCLYTALLAAASARGMLARDGCHVAFQVYFRDADHRRRLLALRVQPVPHQLLPALLGQLSDTDPRRIPNSSLWSVVAPPHDTATHKVMFVGAQSSHASCGAAAAGSLRAGCAVTLASVGINASANALMAAAHAGYFLAREGLALLCMLDAYALGPDAHSPHCVRLALAAG